MAAVESKVRHAYLFLPNFARGRQWFRHPWPPPDTIRVPVEPSLRNRTFDLPVVEDFVETRTWRCDRVFKVFDMAVYEEVSDG